MLTGKEEQYLTSLYDENIRVLMELGKIPAPSHEEEKRAEYLKQWLLQESFSDVWIDGADNVICRMGNPTGPVLCIAAHTDVVCPIREELPMRVENGRIYCPGIGDDTANVVNLLMALKCFRKFAWETDKQVLFVMNSCEEGLGNLKGARQLAKTFPISEFISFDLYQGQCCSGAVGSHRYEITLHTKGGHSYFDYGEANAIVEASRLITELGAQSRKLPGDVRTTMNIGTIKGGTTVNSIPQEAVFTYEYRSESDRNLELMKTQLEEVLEEFKKKTEAEVSVDVIGIRPGTGELDEASLKQFTGKSIEAIRTYYDGPMDLSAFSTDANIPLSLGIPANTIGTAIGAGAHTENEWILLAGQLTGMKIAATVIKAHMNTGDGA